MNRESVWSEALTSVEGLEALRAAHRADGVLTAEEDEAETVYIRSRVIASVGNAAEVLDICQAINRAGPEGYRARALLAQRAKRLGGAAPFPGTRYGAGDEPIALEAA